MRRKFFRLWITFVLTGPRGTPSLSHESLIERPSPSETRTCTSHEKMTRRRDRRRATETDEGIRNEVSPLCLPGVDITRTVINTRNTTMITRSYRAYGMPRSTGCLIAHERLTRSWTFLMYRAATRSLLGSIVRQQSPRNKRHTRLWLDRPLPRYVSHVPRARFALLLERDKKKGSAGKSYPASGSPILQRGSVLLYSNRLRLNERHRSLDCKDLWLLGFSFSPCQRLAARNSNGEEATASCLFRAKLGFLSTSLTDCVGRRTRKEMARFDGDERME